MRMINIRSNIFETNSSSVHSIVIKNNDIYLSKKHDDYFINSNIENGILTIWKKLDFEKEFEILDSIEAKIRYSIASLAYDFSDGPEAFMNMLTNILKKYYPELQSIELNTWDNAYYGNIDPQSSELLSNFLNDKNVSLEDFIMNPKYIVIIDSDSHDELNKLCKTGIMNLDSFEVFHLYD